MRVIEGRIDASQIAEFGSMGIQYGYLSIKTDEGSSTNVKVDAYTVHEELVTGDVVRVELEELGKTGIWVARRITNLGSQLAREESESADVSSSA